jgi:two-component system, chemotaxis family, protein-glutamate methylesterase/glutaminase
MKRVLVVDDSSFMRKSLTYLLESDEAIKVVGTAADGAEAVRKVGQLRPDVVVLDLEMSVMNGLAALTRIMTEHPTPVLVLTGLNRLDATIAIKCLEQGAVDVIPKPSGVISYDIDRLRPEIIAKVKVAAGVNARNLGPQVLRGSCRLPPAAKAMTGDKMVVIGASTGGPGAVASVLLALPPAFAAAVLIVQHMSPVFVPYFAESLKEECLCDVAVAREDEAFTRGCVVVSPGGCHTLVACARGARRVRLSTKPSPHAVFPSVDYAMASAAETYGASAVGILLTGTGSDGAQGMKAIKAAGGRTIAEDPATCLAPGMPQAAINLGCVDQVLPLSLVARAVAEMM